MGRGFKKLAASKKKVSGTGSNVGKKNASNRILSSQQIGAAIQKKYTEAMKKISDHLKANPTHAPRLVSLLTSGVFDEQAPADLLPASTNKFRLLSADNCRHLLNGLVAGADGIPESFVDSMGQVRTKSELVHIICYLCHTCETCAISCRNIPKLIGYLKVRFMKTPDRIKRLAFVTSGKKGKDTGMTPDFANFIFRLTEWKQEEGRYISVTHIDSGSSVPLFDELRITQAVKLLDNCNEYAARLKGKTEINVPAFFNAAPENDEPDFPALKDWLPLNDEVIADRTNSKQSGEGEGGRSASSTGASEKHPTGGRRLQRKASAASAAEDAGPPPGWGGAAPAPEASE